MTGEPLQLRKVESFELVRFVEPITGGSLRAFVNDNIYGRLTMYNEDADVIGSCIHHARAPHYLEIGVSHGGSAILAAYAMKTVQKDEEVHAVDVFEPYGMTRTAYPPEPVIENVQKNVELHGFEDVITLHKQSHPPLPAELYSEQFGVIFIDGDHTFDGVLADWENLRDYAADFVIFHDIDNPAFGAKTVFEIAQKDPEFEFVLEFGKCGVVRRVVDE